MKRVSILALLLAARVWAQLSPQSLTLTAGPPSPIIIVSPTPTAPFGGGSYCWWVIANYPIGHSTPSAPGCSPNVQASAVINWNTVPGATSYDILRTTSPILPSVPANIGVTTGQAGPPYADNFSGLNLYTISTASTATALFLLDNQNQAQPQVRLSIINAGGVNSFILGTGGGGSAASIMTISGNSGTVTFNCGSSTLGTITDFQASMQNPVILSGNLTVSNTGSTCTPGQTLNFLFQQAAAGGPYTVTFPAAWVVNDAPCQVHQLANAITKISFYFDGAQGRLLSCASTAGFSQGTEVPDPATNPPTSFEYFGFSSSRHTPIARDNSGNLKIMPRTALSGDQLGFGDLVASIAGHNPMFRALAFSIGDPQNSAALTTSNVAYIASIPFACTISAYNLAIDAGTITVKFWKVATGTAIPTSGNSISTSGVGISSGTAIHSTTVSDFTTTAVAANDIMAMAVTAVATAKFVSGVLECDQ